MTLRQRFEHSQFITMQVNVNIVSTFLQYQNGFLPTTRRHK